MNSKGQNENLAELESILTGYWLTDLSNFSAWLFGKVDNINWIGFYLSDGNLLRLGPFAGKPACTEIGFNRGVCGAAFSQKLTLSVPDVHEFPGHISCDPDSRSELVIPFVVQGQLVGVLDIDSPMVDRFSKSDVLFFEAALNLLAQKTQGLVSYLSHLVKCE